jgi:hypothetical protein
VSGAGPPSAEGALASCDELALRLAASTRDTLERRTEMGVLSVQGGRALCTALRPYLLDGATYRRALATVELLARGLRSAVERLVHDEPLRRRIGLPPYLDPLVELDRDRGGFFVVGRFDGYLRDGALSCFEFNAPPGSLASSFEANSAFLATPLSRELARRFEVSTRSTYELLLEAVHRDHAARGGTGAPVLGTIRTPPFISPPERELRWLPYLASRGYPVVSGEPDELTLEDGRLLVEDVAVDLFVFPGWAEVADLLDASPALSEAIRTGAVRPMEGLGRGLLCNYKATFELLSDPAHLPLFEPEVGAALRSHIPWTRALRDRRTEHRGVEVDLLRFAEEHREELVLKPSGALSGAGVTLGCEVDDGAWRHALLDGVRRAHVVQERLLPERVRLPFATAEGPRLEERNADLDLYVWNGGRAEGGLVRLSEGLVTNIGAGGTTLPLWILEG